MGVRMPRTPYPHTKKVNKNYPYFLERQRLRRGVVLDGRMPAPHPSPLLQQKRNLFEFSHYYFQ